MGKFIFVLLVAVLGSNMESIHSDVCELACWFYSQSIQILLWPLQLISRMNSNKNIYVKKTSHRRGYLPFPKRRLYEIFISGSEGARYNSAVVNGLL